MTFNETSLSDVKTCNNGSSGQATSASKYWRCQLSKDFQTNATPCSHLP